MPTSPKKKPSVAKKPLRKRRKRGSRRCKTGIHTSPKLKNVMTYRSGWELTFALELDFDPNVVAYLYEPLAIGYVTNVNSGRVRKYFPDFIVFFADGSKKMIEVKRDDKVQTPLIQRKAKAALDWCKKNGATYEFITSVTIKELVQRQKQRAKQEQELNEHHVETTKETTGKAELTKSSKPKRSKKAS